MSMCPYFPNIMDNGIEHRFGLGFHPNDLFSGSLIPRGFNHGLMTGYSRPWSLPRNPAKELMKEQKNIHFGKDGFQACVDVHHFCPSEITVKTVDNQIVIEGKHSERDDGHGSVERHFIRKYTLPKEYDMSAVHSSLSSDGVLTIKAPPPAIEGKSEKHIPITHTNLPAHLNVKNHAKSSQIKADANHAKSPAVQK